MIFVLFLAILGHFSLIFCRFLVNSIGENPWNPFREKLFSVVLWCKDKKSLKGHQKQGFSYSFCDFSLKIAFGENPRKPFREKNFGNLFEIFHYYLPVCKDFINIFDCNIY